MTIIRKILLFFMAITMYVSLAFSAWAAELPGAEENAVQLPVESSFGIDATRALISNDDLARNTDAAFLFEYSSQTLMYAWNADEAMDPASMVKIMTAMIAAEKGTLSDVVVVTESALSTVPLDAVSADLQVDELLTLEELLYCMMVGSANDAASVIAEHIGGSVEAFVQMMNTRAAELGCTNTNFTNPHGIYEESQYSTARDMARILSAAIENDTFAAVFGEIRHQVPATNKSEERDLSSGNFLMNTDEMPLYFDERVTGGRTGVAGDGSRCLAAIAQSNGMSLISIVMGSESVYEENGVKIHSYGSFKETSALFTAGFDGYKVSQILYPGQSLIQMPVQNGTSQVVLGPAESVSAVLPAGISLDNLTFKYEDDVYELAAPVTKGDDVGSLEIWNGGTCIAETNVYALNNVSAIPTADVTDVETKSIIPHAVIIILIIVLVGVAIALVVRNFAKIRNIFLRRRSKRYRRSRRRSR